MTVTTLSSTRPTERAARMLLWLCAAAAALAALSSLPTLAAAGPATRFVELWRVVGFGTFSVLFGTIATAPRRTPTGIWVAVIVNKLVLTVVAIAWSDVAAGAATALWWDGALTVALVIAFTLSRRPR